MSVSRRSFLGVSIGSGAVAIGALRVGQAKGVQPGGDAASQPEAASWSAYTADAAAREVVGLSHRDVDRVRELVTKRPELAKSAVDWGFGDFESAIGAASHVGRPDIVEVLMAHGARPDVFTLAMLGKVDAVRAMVEACPGLQRINGPHSLTLMHHAEAGGEQAASVVEYLSTLEGADDKALSQAVDQPALIVGTYQLTGEVSGEFVVAEGRRGLEFQKVGESTRNLIHVGGLEFHPPGAKSVRFRFTPGGSAADRTSVSIDLGDRVLLAVRRA